MEENKNIWNKKMDELTVGDAVKLNVAVLAITAGSIVGIGVATAAYDKATTKIQQFKSNRQSKKLIVVED